MQNDIKYWLALNNFSKFGPVRFKRIKNYFSSMKEAYQANIEDLKHAGIEEKIAQEFITARIDINPEQLLEKMEREKINIITINDQFYPKLLKEIYDPPPLLYYRGQIENLNQFNLAVVGPRKYSSYGQQVTSKLVGDLTQNNITIVSGLALGIDTLAHNTTLDSGGKTIAVLGSGLDQQSIYPSSNRYLANKIVESGGIIFSEFPLGALPMKHHFPQRNRTIAGLCLATLVIEASEKSGALITARHALEQNREVFAVPGSIFAINSIGTNNLIKLGAKVVSTVSDIIETLDLTQVAEYIDNKKIIPESIEEESILSYLNHEPTHIDELIKLTKLDTSVINSTLTIMEMKGMIKNLGGTQYVISK